MNIKVARNEETRFVGKTNLREKPPLEKSTNFHEIQRNFHDSENVNNEENKLTIKDTNMENNNNEENRLRINGSNIENSINRSAVKSNQGKLALILGDSMVKDVDGYLLTGFINRISSAKTIDMEDYTKPTKRDLTNNFSLDDTPEVMSSRIIDTAKSLIIEKNNELLQT